MPSVSGNGKSTGFRVVYINEGRSVDSALVPGKKGRETNGLDVAFMDALKDLKRVHTYHYNKTLLVNPSEAADCN